MIRVPTLDGKQWMQPNASDLVGNVYVTKNITFDSEGYLSLSNATPAMYSQANDADFDEVAAFCRCDDYGYFAGTHDAPYEIDPDRPYGVIPLNLVLIVMLYFMGANTGIFPKFWGEATYLISLYGLLLRMGMFYKGGDIMQFIDKELKQINQSDYIVFNSVKDKIAKLIEGNIPKQDFSIDRYWHNEGIVNFQFPTNKVKNTLN